MWRVHPGGLVQFAHASLYSEAKHRVLRSRRLRDYLGVILDDMHSDDTEHLGWVAKGKSSEIEAWAKQKATASRETQKIREIAYRSYEENAGGLGVLDYFRKIGYEVSSGQPPEEDMDALVPLMTTVKSGRKITHWLRIPNELALKILVLGHLPTSQNKSR